MDLNYKYEKMYKKIILVSLFFIGSLTQELLAQKATIYEEQLNMKTYMFSDPSPIPQIGRLYPYSRFDGYTNKSEDKLWKMVVLENAYIKVYVCPDIGGKVYGAIEKSTGKEFLYFNHSVKFRDVAMRGAWTSGGLEYNFGDIGHIPTCATPVDYRIKENEDGSVSCIVGALDLPSRTNWNVEIKLSKDKAYFETKATWFNNTALPVTYYHWMNAAAKANGNLEFLYPGNKRIGHGGELGEWPIDGGREIKFYEKNNFGIYKSYHVINSYSDYFGGYYHDDDFGFGHYSTYDDKPGKKIWIWGLSDQGMIWEDLLTDSDGQYIEYQAGKLFNQAANSSTFTPFKHREFSPYDTDIMYEYWFPLKETGGMVAASKFGVLNVEREGDKVTVLLSALQSIKEKMVVKSNGNILFNSIVELAPLQLHTNTFTLAGTEDLEVDLGDHKLYYNSDISNAGIERPIEPNDAFDWESSYGLYVQALELEKQRRYPEALELYVKSYEIEPGFSPTLNRLAMSYYRIMKYNEALTYANLSLGIDTYDALANYNFGLIQLAMKNNLEAKSGFSIASHSTSLRSASYTELAKLFLKENDLNKAELYVNKALAFNKYNGNALEIKAVIYRKQKNSEQELSILSEISDLDASSSFIISEQIFLNLTNAIELKNNITNELSYETYIELALKYNSFGCIDEAIQILKVAPETPMTLIWLAYLNKEDANVTIEKALNLSAEMVFPHRVESVAMLQSLIRENTSWKLKYYLGLIYWNKGLSEDAKKLFTSCGVQPDEEVFYVTKSKLFSDDEYIVNQSLEKAYAINKSDWRVNMARINQYIVENNFESALKISKKYMNLYPENSRFGMYYAKSLMGLKSYTKCITFLSKYNVLPYEGATVGRAIYHEACIKAAYQELEIKNYEKAVEFAEKAKLWPKNLGVGKHYDVDERLDDYIIAYAYEKMGDKSKSDEYYSKISKHVTPVYLNESSKLYLQLKALDKLKEKDKASQLVRDAFDKDGKNQYLKWVKSKYEHDNFKEIQTDILNSNTIVQAYDTKFVDTEFKLVIDFTDIIE